MFVCGVPCVLVCPAKQNPTGDVPVVLGGNCLLAGEHPVVSSLEE